MDSTAADVAGAATFVWLGMVLAISFLETPLKFRAPGVTVPVGLGIGRLVFRALNRVEAVFALGVLAAVAAGGAGWPVWLCAGLACGLLAVQVGVVRPRLNRRSDLVLSGAEDLPRSHEHLYYIALEGAKVLALVALGAVLFAA